MAQAGVISQENANIQIKAAYESVLIKYPDCKAAKIASRWLKKNN
jgi:hypothetical protein